MPRTTETRKSGSSIHVENKSSYRCQNALWTAHAPPKVFGEIKYEQTSKDEDSTHIARNDKMKRVRKGRIRVVKAPQDRRILKHQRTIQSEEETSESAEEGGKSLNGEERKKKGISTKIGIQTGSEANVKKMGGSRYRNNHQTGKNRTTMKSWEA